MLWLRLLGLLGRRRGALDLLHGRRRRLHGLEPGPEGPALAETACPSPGLIEPAKLSKDLEASVLLRMLPLRTLVQMTGGRSKPLLGHPTFLPGLCCDVAEEVLEVLTLVVTPGTSHAWRQRSLYQIVQTPLHLPIRLKDGSVLRHMQEGCLLRGWLRLKDLWAPSSLAAT